MKKGFYSTYVLWLIPALMLFFFARNVVLSSTSYMDSWMGGGMRMFGKVDKMLYRVAGFHAQADGKTYFVNFRNVPSFSAKDTYLRVMPTDERLAEVMKAAAATRWCVDPATGKVRACDDDQQSNAVPLNDLEIKYMVVYKTAFDCDTRKVSLEPINRYPK